MDGQAPAEVLVGLPEHLGGHEGEDHRAQEVDGGGVRGDHEERRLLHADAADVDLVVAQQLAHLGDVEGRQARRTRDEDGLHGLAGVLLGLLVLARAKALAAALLEHVEQLVKLADVLLVLLGGAGQQQELHHFGQRDVGVVLGVLEAVPVEEVADDSVV